MVERYSWVSAYFIRAGTTVWREGAIGREKLTTKKDVSYDEFDFVSEENMGGMRLWKFKLPVSAMPYRHLIVRADDVSTNFPPITERGPGGIIIT